MDRSAGYDLLQPYSTEDRFVTAEDDYFCTRFDITQFEGVQSIRQVYEALLFYVGNIDTSISQELGHIALQEDYDRLDNRIRHQRVVSCDNNGVMHEANAVVFSQFTDCGESDESCGIVATDFVDVDDLFPYRPDTSVRRDITGAIAITAIRRPKMLETSSRNETLRVATESATAEEIDELVVVMRRTTFNVLHHSDLMQSANELRELRESAANWSDIMVTAMRHRLAGSTAT